MSYPSYITFRKHTFLSSVALGLSAVVITLVVSGTVLGIYAVHLAGRQSERVVSLAQGAIRGLPEFTKSLPPALADMLDDRREPQYCSELVISAKVASEPAPQGRIRTAIEITNNGDAVVSLLSLRITILDDRERLLCEAQEWAATPVAADSNWRGPIMPGSTRRFVSYAGCLRHLDPLDALNAQVEVTELRVWNDPKSRSTTPDGPAVEVMSAALMESDNR
jgi:hypothetical protein